MILVLMCFKRGPKWIQGEVAEGFSEGSSRLQTTPPAMLTLGLLGTL